MYCYYIFYVTIIPLSMYELQIIYIYFNVSFVVFGLIKLISYRGQDAVMGSVVIVAVDDAAIGNAHKYWCQPLNLHNSSMMHVCMNTYACNI